MEGSVRALKAVPNYTIPIEQEIIGETITPKYTYT